MKKIGGWVGGAAGSLIELGGGTVIGTSVGKVVGGVGGGFLAGYLVEKKLDEFFESKGW